MHPTALLDDTNHQPLQLYCLKHTATLLTLLYEVRTHPTTLVYAIPPSPYNIIVWYLTSNFIVWYLTCNIIIWRTPTPYNFTVWNPSFTLNISIWHKLYQATPSLYCTQQEAITLLYESHLYLSIWHINDTHLHPRALLYKNPSLPLYSTIIYTPAPP